MLLSNEEFLIQLEQLFKAQQEKGSVFLTSKRYTYEEPSEDTKMEESSASGSQTKTYPCLLRATDGQTDKKAKIKISTLIQPNDTETFTAAYSILLKSSLSTLRKKKKKIVNPKDGKMESKGFKSIKIIGPKRGAGVDKRRRLVRAKERQLKRLWASSRAIIAT